MVTHLGDDGGDTTNSLLNAKEPTENAKSDNHNRNPADKEMKAPAFVNYAAIAWHDSRKKWVGDQSQRAKRVDKDPIISWSTAYEDLLLTNDPFSAPIPLPEIVDFLVDIWHDEGLFD